ncbi:MAG: hypothetical protein IPP47_24155 [Bryobacterales bacterium]|nr:hypothetical protein [Bryobacterales bacterium]
MLSLVRASRISVSVGPTQSIGLDDFGRDGGLALDQGIEDGLDVGVLGAVDLRGAEIPVGAEFVDEQIVEAREAKAGGEARAPGLLGQIGRGEAAFGLGGEVVLRDGRGG